MKASLAQHNVDYPTPIQFGVKLLIPTTTPALALCRVGFPPLLFKIFYTMMGSGTMSSNIPHFTAIGMSKNKFHMANISFENTTNFKYI